ncbi:helix-turn-helix domain-containing protein [Paenibacillus spongiae]|uniref:Helix-turn-helix domain-containing protein n=1 Tax=Paenibacillus spongiae TaxID=2909671 RepID=A0ABY5S6D2_9BACL|nr:helix-turn-helix transcriptional regulator [Paenibacillus spongiae]UVI29469.1 helix-turn-helix domain-containing protein [Paenibacillus spongiae]
MKLSIGAKIAELRKENNITQEQLANALGVSIAAVSKWECASTYPDITLLPAISSYFKVSIDALLDHKVDYQSVQDYRDKVKELARVSDYRAGLPIAEEALKKYPNDFDLLMGMATLTLGAGTSGRSPDNSSVIRAIDYYSRALAVHAPNSPTKKETIMQNMSFAYGTIGEYDKAIAMLEEINIYGCFDLQIAYNMLKSGKRSEAKSKLQGHLFHIAFGFGTLIDNLAECFQAENNMQYVVDLKKLYTVFLESFTHDTPNYCDLLCSMGYYELAKCQEEMGDTDSMWISLEKCVYHAVRFDKNPSYAMIAVKFMDDQQGSVSNNSSQNACRGTLNSLKSDFPQYAADARMAGFIQELEAAATDKRESGIWR